MVSTFLLPVWERAPFVPTGGGYRLAWFVWTAPSARPDGTPSAGDERPLDAPLGCMRAGSIQALRSIQANTIVRVEHLDGARATERFGAEHGAGAILLSTM